MATTSTSGFESIKADILESIEKSGFYTIDKVVLQNTVFKFKEGHPSTNEQMQSWALENKLRFNEETISHGKKNEVLVRFTRLK